MFGRRQDRGLCPPWGAAGGCGGLSGAGSPVDAGVWGMRLVVAPRHGAAACQVPVLSPSPHPLPRVSPPPGSSPWQRPRSPSAPRRGRGRGGSLAGAGPGSSAPLPADWGLPGCLVRGGASVVCLFIYLFPSSFLLIFFFFSSPPPRHLPA